MSSSRFKTSSKIASVFCKSEDLIVDETKKAAGIDSDDAHVARVELVRRDAISPTGAVLSLIAILMQEGSCTVLAFIVLARLL